MTFSFLQFGVKFFFAVSSNGLQNSIGPYRIINPEFFPGFLDLLTAIRRLLTVPNTQSQILIRSFTDVVFIRRVKFVGIYDTFKLILSVWSQFD